jgi:hypothetical protein
MLYAGNNLDKARKLFADAVKHEIMERAIQNKSLEMTIKRQVPPKSKPTS